MHVTECVCVGGSVGVHTHVWRNHSGGDKAMTGHVSLVFNSTFQETASVKQV